MNTPVVNIPIESPPVETHKARIGEQRQIAIKVISMIDSTWFWFANDEIFGER